MTHKWIPRQHDEKQEKRVLLTTVSEYEMGNIFSDGSFTLQLNRIDDTVLVLQLEKKF